MSCLPPRAIARLASDDDAHDLHLDACARCRDRVAAERGLRGLLRTLPAPRLEASHARELGAEVVARAQLRVTRGRHAHPARLVALAAGLAAAAAVGIAVAVHAVRADAPTVAILPGELAAPAEAAAPPPVRITAREDPATADPAPPSLPAPRIATAGTARFTSFAAGARTFVALADGALELDTRGARAIEVRVGGDRVEVEEARVRVRARGRELIEVHVELGAARVIAEGQPLVLERGAVWVPTPRARPPELADFEAGWIALREGRNADAVARFDRVDDPVAREEAMFWAAIAARRAGDAVDADAREARFVAAYPDSIYRARLIGGARR